VLALAATTIACFLASLAVTEVVRRIAIRRSLLDKINERSLHSAPTPRLGGVGIVAVSAASGIVSWNAESANLHGLIGMSFVLALVGLRDDLRPMSAATRLALHFALAIAFVAIAGPAPLLVARDVALPVGSVATRVLLAIWIVGVLNIYNFMDGMDGLAGSQAASAAFTLALLFAGASGGGSLFAVAVGGASLGFLAQNVPPARIFMGDAGSTFLGMTFATLAILGLAERIPITQTALPLAPFLLDGTFTILRRALRKERVWTAHRSHLYQRAVQTGLGHRDVLLVYLGWIATSALAAVLASLGNVALALGWAVALLWLGGVWLWVVRRESDRANLA
jgi:Fuc2NAc and GlcNAc transferase